MWREGEELLVVVVVSISSTYVCVWVRPGDTIGLNHGWKTRKKTSPSDTAAGPPAPPSVWSRCKPSPACRRETRKGAELISVTGSAYKKKLQGQKTAILQTYERLFS